eukprot:scaffold2930_cov376-Prasinococcus_capsulatus_cf.AAC.5
MSLGERTEWSAPRAKRKKGGHSPDDPLSQLSKGRSASSVASAHTPPKSRSRCSRSKSAGRRARKHGARVESKR